MPAEKNIQHQTELYSVLIVFFIWAVCLSGGAEEDRTPDLLRARQALSQLSYGPFA